MKVFFFGEHQPCHYPFQTNLQFDFCLFCFERFSILASHRTFSKGWLKQTVERFLLSIKMKHQNFKEKPFTLSTWWNNLIWLKNHNWKINFLSWLMWFSKLFLNFPYHQNILELYQIQNCIQNISILNVVQGIPHAYHLFQADVDRPCFQQKQSQQFFHNVSPMNIFREIAHTYTHTHLSCFWCKRSKRSKRRLENCALFGRRVSSDVLVVVVQDRVQCQLVKVGHKLH